LSDDEFRWSTGANLGEKQSAAVEASWLRSYAQNNMHTGLRIYKAFNAI
jgi:hypothetical protein